MGSTALYYIVMIGAFFAIFYFMLIRPQKKEQAKQEALLSSIEIGDSVITTAGFYGVVIDIMEEQNVVIIEFGNNKNCRIPAKKSCIIEVEKANKN